MQYAVLYIMNVREDPRVDRTAYHFPTIRSTKGEMKLIVAFSLVALFEAATAEVASLTMTDFGTATAGKVVFVKFFAPWYVIYSYSGVMTIVLKTITFILNNAGVVIAKQWPLITRNWRRILKKIRMF
jgi:hypothetical protein